METDNLGTWLHRIEFEAGFGGVMILSGISNCYLESTAGKNPIYKGNIFATL